MGKHLSLRSGKHGADHSNSLDELTEKTLVYHVDQEADDCGAALVYGLRTALVKVPAGSILVCCLVQCSTCSRHCSSQHLVAY